MRLDKFLTEMGLGTRSEVKKLLKTKQITGNRSFTVNMNIIFFINRQGV